MKILVPTDFSSHARTALEFALCLFGKFKPEIILLNTWQIPHTGTGMLVSIEDLLREDAERAMSELLTEFVAERGNDADFRALVKEGSLVEVIKGLNRKEAFDYIIMGTTGSDDVRKKLLGSNTANVLRTSSVPVIVIPDGTRCEAPHKISLATDYQPLQPTAAEHIGKFATLSDATFEAVHVHQEVIVGGVEEKRINIGGRDSVVVHVQAPSVSEGLDTYLSSHGSDMLIIVRRDYGFIERIFHKSVSRALAMHTQTPLLIIPE